MTTITIPVRTQAELDEALDKHGSDPSATIVIDSPRGVWLTVGSPYSARVRVHGSSSVRAYASSIVDAYGEATVEAYDSATVGAAGSSTVRANNSSTVIALDLAAVIAYSSATVRAYDSSTVRAYDSVKVRAYDSATVNAYDLVVVEAFDMVTVRAAGSATVRAYGSTVVDAAGSSVVDADDSSSVNAYDSATVRAYGTSTVLAAKYVAVHIHSTRVTLTGGVVIGVTDLALRDPQVWAKYTGATVRDGLVHMYKAVDDDFYAGHTYIRTRYPIGETVTATDWRDDHSCGGGLHVSPHVWQAHAYFPEATRFLEVTVPLADIRPIGADKIKARSVTVVREVDKDGNPL